MKREQSGDVSRSEDVQVRARKPWQAPKVLTAQLRDTSSIPSIIRPADSSAPGAYYNPS